jgi:predicted transcriptional regulator of viral defense system
MQQETTPAYLSLPADHCFDHTLLSDRLQAYRSVGDKISLMLRRGEIIQVRRGLYVRSPKYGGTVEPMEIANLLYGPSYISLEYALSYYDLIPERVESITSVTPKRSKKFLTPLASFTYEHISQKAYPTGINLEKKDGIGVLIASKEKAMCDRIALASNIRTMREIEEYIFENLRIDKENISNLSKELLENIGRAYHLKRIALFVRWYRKNFGKA